MPSDLQSVLNSVADRLITLASTDPELRSQLRELAHAVLDATSEPEPVPAQREPLVAEIGEQRPAATDGEPTEVLPTRRDHERLQPLPELTLGQPKAYVEPATPSYAPRLAVPSDVDLHLIERRCRLKAEGSRWAATRRRLISEGAIFAVEIDPVDQEIIAKAKAIPDCFLWMCNANTAPSPSDLRGFETLARSYETVADALAVMRHVLKDAEQHPSEFEQCLDLLAEAQSALRAAIMNIDGPTDSDQMQVFTWLKATAAETQIFIQRYMRADDPADPSQWEDLLSRIEAVDAVMQETEQRDKKRRKLIGKIRHKLSLIDDDPEGAEGHWEILISTVDELISDGMPPSNRELRELLIPAIDQLPDLPELPQSFELVLREIDRFLATSPAPERTSATQPTQQVQEVAKLLKGRCMVLIGGERRPASEQLLKEAFRLSEVIWIGTREHQPIDGFEPYIARPDVAVVLLAIRWSSHSHGDVKVFCDRHGKPLVRLPTGYNPNQVAVQILEQCSERSSCGGRSGKPSVPDEAFVAPMMAGYAGNATLLEELRAMVGVPLREMTPCLKLDSPCETFAAGGSRTKSGCKNSSPSTRPISASTEPVAGSSGSSSSMGRTIWTWP